MIQKALAKIVFILVALNINASAQNYKEELVPNFKLPDVLTANKGILIKTQQSWEKIRRQEIIQMFEDNVYGQFPRDLDSVQYQPQILDKSAMGGKALLKQVDILLFRKVQHVTIQLVMFIPTALKKPAPLFLLINNRSQSNTDPSRIKKTEFWPVEKLIDSGYAIAAFHVGDLAPDHKVNYKNAVLQLYPDQLSLPNGMRAIGAWAWGATRIMDYFQTDVLIDAQKVAIVGHSRGGKAALWASAQDPRFWMCFSSCSGNSGAALSRRRYGETIAKINETFPHWFCDNYKKFNNRENNIAVDQHMLIALSAPRPIYTTNATEDRWADPKGSYLSLQYASPVYALYGLDVMLPPSLPSPNHFVGNLSIGYHLRSGMHDLNAFDWGNFITFANLQLKRK